MFGRLSIALLIAASPAAAAQTAPAESDTAVETSEPQVAYKTKKVCRSIEVVGSAIPRRACTTKRIPIKPVDEEAQADSAETEQPSEPST